MTDLDRLDAPRTCTFCGAGVDPRLLAAVRERDELREAAGYRALLVAWEAHEEYNADVPGGHVCTSRCLADILARAALHREDGA